MITTLTIDAIIGPDQQSNEFSQEYEDLEQASLRRTADNSGVLRVTGQSKVRTVMRGKGWAPSAFEQLSRGQSYLMRCAMVRVASSVNNLVGLPAARRSDPGHDPIGFALVGGELVETPISQIVADVATLAVVAGAVGYRVHYFPELTVAITVNTAQGQASADHEWQIEAEEL